MSAIDSLETMLHEELKDLYDAETRLTKALPKMIKKASDEGLRAALEAHLEETRTHVTRLEQAFELIGEPAKAKTCAAMKGLIEEGDEHLKEDYGSDALRDVAIVGAGQRVEHYEMAAYGNAIAHARQLGKGNVADLLEQTLAEEKAADEKLTEVGEPLNAAAVDGDDEEESGAPARGKANAPADHGKQAK